MNSSAIAAMFIPVVLRVANKTKLAVRHRSETVIENLMGPYFSR